MSLFLKYVYTITCKLSVKFALPIACSMHVSILFLSVDYIETTEFGSLNIFPR